MSLKLYKSEISSICFSRVVAQDRLFPRPRLDVREENVGRDRTEVARNVSYHGNINTSKNLDIFGERKFHSNM